MANIIPTTGATGSSPLMLHELLTQASAGGYEPIGSLRSSADKPAGGGSTAIRTSDA